MEEQQQLQLANSSQDQELYECPKAPRLKPQKSPDIEIEEFELPPQAISDDEEETMDSEIVSNINQENASEVNEN